MPAISETSFMCLIFFLLATLSGCANQPTAQAKTDPTAPFATSALISPAPAGAIEQRLVALPDGRLLSAWWDNAPESRENLKISAWKNNQWSQPVVITGMPKIVDVQLTGFAGDKLAALWMIGKAAESGEVEVHDIYLAWSDNGGADWSQPVRINQEKSSSMKESPALTALADGALMAAWIDMRNITLIPPQKPGDEMRMEGYTALYAARMGADNQPKEVELDKDFCDCCGPALTDDGNDGLVVYRDHKPDNIRDPALVRVSLQGSSQPVSVHDDHWKIDACPSKGPAISRYDNTVGVIWLTMVNDKFIIRAAFSGDKGAHFGKPIDLEPDGASNVSGIVMDSPHSALVSWTKSGDNGEVLKLARVFDDGRIEHPTVVHPLTNGGAFRWPGPRMVKSEDALIFSWNDEQDKKMGLVKVKVAE